MTVHEIARLFIMLHMLRLADLELYFLTGEIGSLDEMPDPRGRVKQLAEILKWSEPNPDCLIHICRAPTMLSVAGQKAMFCKKHNIDLFIDDQPMFINTVRALSPKTVCLQVHA